MVRELPNDLDAEASCLSAALLKSTARDTVTAALRPEDFFSKANARIHEAILDLTKRDEPVDATTVCSWLRGRRLLDECGGAAYLAQIVDATPAVGNVEAHCRIVRDLARLRRCIEEAEDIRDAAYAAAADAQTFLDQSATRLATIADSGRETSMRSIGDIVREEFSSISAAAKRGSELVGTPSGYASIDKLTCGWQPTEQYVIAARPGMGKTSIMMSTALSVAAHKRRRADGTEFHDQWVAVFSLEMGSGSLVRRSLASEARVDSNKVRSGQLTIDDWRALTTSAKALSPLPLFIDDKSGASPIEVRAKCKRLAATAEAAGARLALIAIDYAQLMNGRPLVGPRDNREREVAEVSKYCKRIAKELGVPMLLLAQLNRPPKTTGCPPEPQLSDLRESGSLEQDADGVLFIHRKEYYLRGATPDEDKGVADVIMAKQRNGPTGTVRMRFDGRFVLFSELDEMSHGYAPPDDEAEEYYQ